MSHQSHVEAYRPEEGLSLRDYFAAMAMQGMLSCQDFVNELIRTTSTKSRQEARKLLSEFAYKQADAMLEERSNSLGQSDERKV